MADEERLLKILLKYVTDVRSVEQAKAAAGKLTEAQKAAGKAGQTAGEKTATATAFAAARMELLEKRTRLVNAEVEKLKRNAGALQQISASIAGAGALIAGPFVAAALAYTSQAGRAEETSRKWGRTTAQIADAYQDVGRVAARTLLPLLERAADLAEVVARLAEQHPGAVAAALGIGGGLLALGTLGTIAAQGIRLYADVKLLGAAALQNVAADKMLAAAGLQSGGAGAGGLGSLALFAGPAGLAAAALAGMQYFGWRAASGAYGPGSQSVARGAAGDPNALAGILSVAFGRALGGALVPLVQAVSGQRGQSPTVNQMGSRPGGTSPATFGAAVQLYASYQQQLIAFEQDYGRRKTQIILDYAKRGIEIEQQYQEDRARIAADFSKSQGRELRDFLENERRTQREYAERVRLQLRDFARGEERAEQGYYEQRLKRARDFDIETQRAEEDHQARLLEFQADHADRARDFAGAQDALGLVKEQRRYEKERQQEELAYSKEARRRNEDYARELDDGEQAFREQREQRLADFEQQQADQKEQFQKDRAERKADFAQRRADERQDFQQRLADLDAQHIKAKEKNEANFAEDLRAIDSQHTREKAKLEQDFKDRLNQLDAALLGEQKKRQDYYRRMALDLEDFLRAARDHQPYVPRKDSQYPQPSSSERLVNSTTTQTSGGGSAALTVNMGGLAFQGASGQQLVQSVMSQVEGMLTAAFDQFSAHMGAA